MLEGVVSRNIINNNNSRLTIDQATPHFYDPENSPVKSKGFGPCYCVQSSQADVGRNVFADGKRKFKCTIEKKSLLFPITEISYYFSNIYLFFRCASVQTDFKFCHLVNNYTERKKFCKFFFLCLWFLSINQCH